jgi:hypothetical protein
LFNNRDDKTINIPAEIVEVLQKEGLSELEALEQSDSLTKRAKRLIANKLKDNEIQGTTPKYAVDKSNDDILVRIDLSVEANKEKDARKILVWKEQIFETIKKISWQEFEKLCKLVLEANNVSDLKVTRGVKDGGVDVYGWLRFNTDSRRIFRDLNIRVIGQGKHRTSGGEVSNADVSEFVTDIDKLRRKQGTSLLVLPQEFIDSLLPLMPIFITNGYYGEDATITGNEHGVILWNGEQISEDIARHLDLSPFLITGDKIELDRLRAYLNSL